MPSFQPRPPHVVPPVRPKGRKTLRNSAPPNAKAPMDSAEFPTGSPNFHSCDFETTHRCFCLTSEAVALDWGSNLASLERSGGRAASEGPFSGEATGVTWRTGGRAPVTPQQPERPIAEGAAATPHAQIANSKPKLWNRRVERLHVWPAPGSEDTELGVLMELEVGHGETEVYARVQA
jgi:hypothetical protein